jgi:hypothetical protein
MAEATSSSGVTTQITIDLGTNKAGNPVKGAVKVPGDVMNYFGILAPTTGAEEMITRKRKASTQTRYSGLDDRTGKSVTVSASTWKSPVRAAKGTTGKPVRIPTELKTPEGNIRFVTLRFPAGAEVGQISGWLFEKIVKNKPSYFIHNGNRYSVLRLTGVSA